MRQVVKPLLLLTLCCGILHAGGKKPEMRRKLKQVVVPRICFDGAPVDVVFSFLKQISRRQGEDVNFVLILEPKKKNKRSK